MTEQLHTIINDENDEVLERGLTMAQAEIALCRHINLGAEDAYIGEDFGENMLFGPRPTTVTYTNWQGETRVRTITPSYIWHGSTKYHTEPQWLIRAWDEDKQALRDFALKGFARPEQLWLGGCDKPTPLGGKSKKNTDFCRCEGGNAHVDCGCAFGQCEKGLIY